MMPLAYFEAQTERANVENRLALSYHEHEAVTHTLYALHAMLAGEVESAAHALARAEIARRSP